jgi:hypothetical protein
VVFHFVVDHHKLSVTRADRHVVHRRPSVSAQTGVDGARLLIALRRRRHARTGPAVARQKDLQLLLVSVVRLPMKGRFQLPRNRQDYRGSSLTFSKE